MVNIIEKPWALGSDLAVFGLLQPHALGFLNYRQDGLCQWEGSAPFLSCNWGQCSPGSLWFSVPWQPVCWWPPAGVLDTSDLSPCHLVRWTEPFVLREEGRSNSTEWGGEGREERGVVELCFLAPPMLLSQSHTTSDRKVGMRLV